MFIRGPGTWEAIVNISPSNVYPSAQQSHDVFAINKRAPGYTNGAPVCVEQPGGQSWVTGVLGGWLATCGAV